MIEIQHFKINDTKLFVPVVTLSAQENINFLNNQNLILKEQLIGIKIQLKQQNRYLDYLIDLSFQGVNRLFVLAFEDDNAQESPKQYYLPTGEIKYYNAMIDGRNLFDQPIKNDLKTYDNIRMTATG